MAIDVFEKQTILTLKGGPVCVYETGQANLPPVLLLHGAMYDESRFIWHHLAPALSMSRHVYAIDFPRHGKSRPWAGTIDQQELQQVVGAVIDHFGLPPLPLIGLSMGGGVAIGFALEYPEKVTGGIFMGPGGLGDRVSNQFLSWLFVKTPGALRSFAWYYAKLSPQKMRNSVISMLQTRENSQDLDDLTSILCEEARLKWKNRELSMDDWQKTNLAPFRLKMNFLPQVHRLSCPTLWLRGESDPLVGQAVMEEAANTAPNGSLCVVTNAGHLLPLEQPEQVHGIIREFLASHDL